MVFVDQKRVELALEAVCKLHKSHAKSGRWPIWGEGVEGKLPARSAQYLTHHRIRYPDHAILPANTDAYTTNWDKREGMS